MNYKYQRLDKKDISEEQFQQIFAVENAEVLGVIGSEKLFSNYSLLQKVIEEN